MAWDPAQTLQDRFASALTCLRSLFPSRRRPGRTYRGFTDALVRLSPHLVPAVQGHLRSAVDQLGHPLREGWHAFAVDGSRIDCPRTEANEAAFGLAGRAGTSPQMWLTTLWHMGTGLPWAWQIGDARSSERDHLRQMLPLLPPQALLIADAGFTGYELMQALPASGRFFLIRIGGNRELLRELGVHPREGRDTVYLWPKTLRRGLPLVLRLIRINTVYLVTNVLEPTRLSKATAGKLYRARWGVEVFYRSFKQTLQRRKMRSDSPRAAVVELQWSLIGLLVLGLLQARALIARGRDPVDGSAAGALRVLRGVTRQAGQCRGGLPGLLARLAAAVKDCYRRRHAKRARDWPHKKYEPPTRPPKIRKATPSEVQRAQRLRERTTTE
jgi:hypothetical protein